MGLTVYGGGGKPEEEKTVTAGTSAIVVNPSSGKVMKKVTVNPTPTESKSVTPTTSELTVTPSEGKHLSQVVVGAVEDVTPEVTAQTPVITQIAENLGVTITTPSGTNKQILQGNNTNLLNIKNNAKKAGVYVWRKRAYNQVIIPENAKVSFLPGGTSAWEIIGEEAYATMSSDDVDVTKLVTEDFNGGTGKTQYGDNITSISNGKMSYSHDAEPCSFRVDNGIFYISSEFSSWVRLKPNYINLLANTKVNIGDFIDYVVSDDPTAYPDGGEQGGYWYEKVTSASFGIAFGEVVLAEPQETITVAHGLSKVPSLAYLVPKDGFGVAQTKTILMSIGDYVWYLNNDTNTIVRKNATQTKTNNSITFPASTSRYYRGTYKWFAIV